MIREIDSTFSTQLVPLMEDLGYPGQTKEQIRRRVEKFLTHGSSKIFGLFEKEALIGFASLSLIPLIHEDGNLGRISAFAISKDHQGIGLGKKLISFVEEIAFSMNCIRIEITSGSQRSNGAHKFYSAIGYEQYSGSRFLKRRPID